MDIFLKAQARLDFKDEDGENLLMIAADYKQLAAAKAFINTKKLNLKDVNKDGESALYVAVREKFFPLVELYLQSGVDPNIPRADGRTALYEAIDQRDQKIARSLYRHGASLTPKDTDGLDGKEYLLKKDLKLKWLVGS
jgi:ankyrin repeat protein